MDFFHISYLLSKACLGELNQNFRRIYFSINNEKIKVYFILEEKNQDDGESIEEIMSEFSMLIENFLEASELEDNYMINSETILNAEDGFFLKKPEYCQFFEEFYRRKE